MSEEKAPIAEVFTSIDGEVNWFGQGVLSRFVRVAGCNLSCPQCDTPLTQTTVDFPWYSLAELLSVNKLLPKERTVHKFTITGGEPLLYRRFVESLILYLRRAGYNSTVETNGTQPLIPNLLCGWVVDNKPPSSGSSGRFVYGNLPLMNAQKDMIKMVLSTKEDLGWAIEETRYLSSVDYNNIPIAWGLCEGGELDAYHIINTLLEKELGFVRFNAQIHKYLKLK